MIWFQNGNVALKAKRLVGVHNCRNAERRTDGNPRHHPPLLGQRGQGDFVPKDVSGLDGCIVRRALRFNLIAKCWRADEVVEEAAVEPYRVDFEQEVVAVDDGAVECAGYDAKATNLGVDFGNKKFACAADLLLLGLDECARHLVARNDALGVELNAWPPVNHHIINGDELLAVAEHFPQPRGRPLLAHRCPIGRIRARARPSSSTTSAPRSK